MKKVLTLLLLLTIISTGAYAKEYKFANGEFSPFTSESLDGGGFYTEIITEVLKEMGDKGNFNYYPWARSEKMVTDGDALGTFPWITDNVKEKVFLFTDVVVDTGEKFFYNKKYNPNPNPKKMIDLKDKSFGGTRSYHHVPKMEEWGLTVDVAPSDKINFKKLGAGRIDFFPSNEITGWNTIKRLFPGQEKNFGVLEIGESPTGYVIMIDKNNPEAKPFIKRFNKALAKVKKSSFYKAIMKKYTN